MDKRLQQALDFSQYMTTINNQKRLLQEKFLESTLFFYNGGKFTITPELLTYTSTSKLDIILDDNLLPVEIDMQDFYSKIKIVYEEALLDYNQEYKKIKAKRSVEKILND